MDAEDATGSLAEAHTASARPEPQANFDMQPCTVDALVAAYPCMEHRANAGDASGTLLDTRIHT